MQRISSSISRSKNVNLIACCDLKNGIGSSGKLPWHLSQEMKLFTRLSSNTLWKEKQNAVIMGRNTWESIPSQFMPLQNRKNFVVSSTLETEKVQVCSSVDSAIHQCQQDDSIESIFLIGGNSIYHQGLLHPDLNKIYLSRVNHEFECDTYFPLFTSLANNQHTWNEKSRTDGKNYEITFREYNNELQGEYQYLRTLKKIKEQGYAKEGRNGITYSLPGHHLSFNLQDGFPMLTTKRIFLRGIFEELMWFLRGSTDVRELQEKKIHFWDANVTSEFIANQKHLEIDLPENCLGAGYGHQMRNFGSQYVPFLPINEYPADNPGVDQLQKVIDGLQKNPFDRRHIITLWNPKDLNKAALPPCHSLVLQFLVEEQNDTYLLKTLMYQRSADFFHGVPFNITSNSLLTHLIADHLNKNDGDKKWIAAEFHHFIADAHIYDSHLEAVETQLGRIPYSFPTLKIDSDASYKSIDQYNYFDIQVKDYQKHGYIKVPMVA